VSESKFGDVSRMVAFHKAAVALANLINEKQNGWPTIEWWDESNNLAKEILKLANNEPSGADAHDQ